MTARLRVGGHVSAPNDFAFADLRSFAEQITEVSSLLAGREIGGLPLPVLLTRVGVQADACAIVAESADGSFSTTLSLDAAAQCIIVYRVGNVALPGGLGGPFRLITQGRLRCGDIKQLGSLYVSDRHRVELAESERICVHAPRAA